MKKILLTIFAACMTLLVYADDKPSFPGGEEALKAYISQHTQYPEIAKENGVEGIVVVGFIVTTDGNIKDSKVVKFIDPDLEREALRVVNGMPAWIPAEVEGVAVEAPAKVDIPFILE